MSFEDMQLPLVTDDIYVVVWLHITGVSSRGDTTVDSIAVDSTVCFFNCLFFSSSYFLLLRIF